MEKIELLAPAKNIDTAKAAIDCGADAVYIGAEQFSARVNASNSIWDIEDLITYAHTYWARVYVAVNTLLTDDEIPEAVEMIWKLHEAQADGIILQDTGLLECSLPPIPLIASTQMHIYGPKKARFLEEAGFSRLILARELSLEEITEIAGRTKVELECFVHGSLCVSYSGQCWMSYAVGGRSGNRGECAQPCRNVFSLIDGTGQKVIQDKHLLSLKDMNRSDYLEQLVEAGVTSFKIEGRLKDTAYVRNTVAYYSSLLDSVCEKHKLQRSSCGRSEYDFQPNPEKTFNRGYTPYFLSGRERNMASFDTPKSRGEYIGQVDQVGKVFFTTEWEHDLHNGDGICFYNDKGVLTGTNVNMVQRDKVFPKEMKGIKKGMPLFRNRDHQFLKALEKSSTARKIGTAFTLSGKEGTITLRAEDENGITAEVEAGSKADIAENKALAEDTIRNQLSKTGSTPFRCTDIHIKVKPLPFFKPAFLNKLRRDVLALLEEKRKEGIPRIEVPEQNRRITYPEQELTFTGNVLNKKAEAFYKRHGVKVKEPAAETGLDMKGRQIMTTKYCLRYELGACLRRDTSPNPEPMHLVNEKGDIFPLKFNCKECLMEVYFKEKSDE